MKHEAHIWDKVFMCPREMTIQYLPFGVIARGRKVAIIVIGVQAVKVHWRLR